MEKIDNNKTEYKYIEQPIYLCNLKTNQKPITKESQINHSKGRSLDKGRSTDSLSSTYPLYIFKRFYKSGPAFPVKTVEKKTTKYPSYPYKGQDLIDLALQQQKGEGKAFMQLQELKKKFCNLLMRNGEKSKAYKLFYESLKQVEDKGRQSLVKKTKEKEGYEGYEGKIPHEEGTRYDTKKGYDTELFDFFAARKKSVQQEKDKEQVNDLELFPEKGKLNLLVSPVSPVSLQIHSRSEKEGRDTTHVDFRDPYLYPFKGGNKEAEQYFYTEFLRKNTLYQAVENVKPTLELRRVRKGGTTYQVPAIVSQKRQERVAIKWIIESAEKRKKRDTRDKKSNHSFSDCLVSEILDAFNKTGQPRQRRDEQLKVAEYNRAYTRYRWW